MLVLTRRLGDGVIIEMPSFNIELVVTKIEHNKVGLGIVAPSSVNIARKELLKSKESSNETFNSTDVNGNIDISKPGSRGQRGNT